MKAIFILLILTSSAFAGPYTSLIATQTAVVTMAEQEKEKVPRNECTECGGTGKIKAGDGQTVAWRECDNCYEVAQAEPECNCDPCICTDCKCEDCKCDPLTCGRETRWLFFTADWCVPCLKMKGKLEPDEDSPHVLERLLASGWSVGDRNDHIELIDADKRQDLIQKYNIRAIPTLLLIHKGRIVHRIAGEFNSAETIGNLWNKHK